GCYSQGETIEETMKNIKEAIESHLIVLKEDETIPSEEDFVIARVNVSEFAVA
ncbi:MAG: type II toxin-antitoxin system HicB family antitoxin, partial [Candidatus Methanoperedens sp.]|nr:type II toxin-antitoxin system HicB family antitoxin [Candidatus Methanoperedens sp.]